MSASVERLIKKIDGNGQAGLSDLVAQQSIKIDNLVKTIEGLSVNVSALMKFSAEQKSVDLYKEKEGLSGRQRASIYISAILGTASIATAIILKVI